MTALVLTARRSWAWSGDALLRPNAWAVLLAAAVLAIVVNDAAARDIVLASLSDAYIEVSTFVAGSLALFYGLERLFRFDAGALLQRHRKWQVPVAALLGALPGCGGAIVVITHYVRGHVGFGAVLAVLTATMGDAAFLLLARDPAAGAGIFVMGFAVGTVAGLLVEKIHGPGFMRRPSGVAMPSEKRRASLPWLVRPLNGAWVALMVPGLVLGVLAAFQVDTDAVFGTAFLPEPTLWIGVAGSVLAVAMWANNPSGSLAANVAEAVDPKAGDCGRPPVATGDRIIADTNFVTAWVVLAFLAYELGVHVTGVDLQSVFAVWAPLVPLIGVILGLLPGCGPQVVVTTLYLSGVVPLSAQIGNAISNDGDALFPALAVAPRAALVATLYSAVPALIVAYGWWALFE